VAFDEGLAERIRDLIGADPVMSERKMFGGLCFMCSGNMCFGIMGNDLFVRVGPDASIEFLAKPHVREMDFTGRVMRGIVLVDPLGFTEDRLLRDWLDRGLEFAESLPPK
jgi:TfoX/Sxy family transcriptional regulator of competence genes